MTCAAFPIESPLNKRLLCAFYKVSEQLVYLSDKASGRDNNLNLIRALAASAVLVSHAYPIALGPDAIQPLKLLTDHYHHEL